MLHLCWKCVHAWNAFSSSIIWLRLYGAQAYAECDWWARPDSWLNHVRARSKLKCFPPTGKKWYMNVHHIDHGFAASVMFCISICGAQRCLFRGPPVRVFNAYQYCSMHGHFLAPRCWHISEWQFRIANSFLGSASKLIVNCEITIALEASNLELVSKKIHAAPRLAVM